MPRGGVAPRKVKVILLSIFSYCILSFILGVWTTVKYVVVSIVSDTSSNKKFFCHQSATIPVM